MSNAMVEALKEARQFILAPAEDLLWGVVHRIDAALADPVAPVAVSVKDETAWLIELRGSRPTWWSLHPEEEPGWVPDANKALRFSRKQDADAYINDTGWTDAFATEHMWSAHRPHDWFEFKGMKCCRSCGNVWNATSDTRSCKGPSKVELRSSIIPATKGGEDAIRRAAIEDVLGLLTGHELYRYRPKAFNGFIEYARTELAALAQDTDATPHVAPTGTVATVAQYCDVLDSCIETFWCLTKEGADNRLLADGAFDAVKGIRRALSVHTGEGEAQ